jgi:hypothetical protein
MPLPGRWHKTGYTSTRHPAAANQRDIANRHTGRTDDRALDTLVICRTIARAATIHKQSCLNRSSDARLIGCLVFWHEGA